ncbi:MAG: hypothetical protein WC981_02895 [Candidatus Dojkabacteria bacterium]
MIKLSSRSVEGKITSISVTDEGRQLLGDIYNGKTGFGITGLRGIKRILDILIHSDMKSKEQLYKKISDSGSDMSYASFQGAFENAIGYGLIKIQSGYKKVKPIVNNMRLSNRIVLQQKGVKFKEGDLVTLTKEEFDGLSGGFPVTYGDIYEIKNIHKESGGQIVYSCIPVNNDTMLSYLYKYFGDNILFVYEDGLELYVSGILNSDDPDLGNTIVKLSSRSIISGANEQRTLLISKLGLSVEESNEIIKSLRELDPTPRYSYMDWIVREYCNNSITDDNKDKLKELLIKYNTAKTLNKLVDEQRDIFNYNINTLETLIKSFSDVDILTQEEKDNYNIRHGTKLVYSDTKYKVLEILNTEEGRQAWMVYSRYPLPWCTKNWPEADYYLNEAKRVFIIFEDNKPKYSVLDGKEIYNEDDVKLTLFIKELFEEYRNIHHIIIELGVSGIGIDDLIYAVKYTGFMSDNDVSKSIDKGEGLDYLYMHQKNISDENISKAIDKGKQLDILYYYQKNMTQDNISKAIDNGVALNCLYMYQKNMSDENISKAIDRGRHLSVLYSCQKNMTQDNISKAMDKDDDYHKMDSLYRCQTLSQENISKAIDSGKCLHVLYEHQKNISDENISKAIDKGKALDVLYNYHESKMTPQQLKKIETLLKEREVKSVRLSNRNITQQSKPKFQVGDLVVIKDWEGMFAIDSEYMTRHKFKPTDIYEIKEIIYSLGNVYCMLPINNPDSVKTFKAPVDGDVTKYPGTLYSESKLELHARGIPGSDDPDIGDTTIKLSSKTSSSDFIDIDTMLHDIYYINKIPELMNNIYMRGVISKRLDEVSDKLLTPLQFVLVDNIKKCFRTAKIKQYNQENLLDKVLESKYTDIGNFFTDIPRLRDGKGPHKRRLCDNYTSLSKLCILLDKYNNDSSFKNLDDLILWMTESKDVWEPTFLNEGIPLDNKIIKRLRSKDCPYLSNFISDSVRYIHTEDPTVLVIEIPKKRKDIDLASLHNIWDTDEGDIITQTAINLLDKYKEWYSDDNTAFLDDMLSTGKTLLPKLNIPLRDILELLEVKLKELSGVDDVSLGSRKHRTKKRRHR